MEQIPEYPPILTNNSQQDIYNLREYIIRNLERQSAVSGCRASVYFEAITETLETIVEESSGKAGNLQDNKAVTPTTTEQTITPDSGYDGLKKVTVDAAPTETLSVTPSGNAQTFNPSPGKVGFSQVSVAGVSAELEPLSVTPGNIAQTLYPPTGKIGFSSVSVAAVDQNLLEAETVTPTTSQQVLTPSEGKMGFSEVTVNAAPLETPATVTPGASNITIAPSGNNIGLAQVVVAGDADLIAANIKKDIVIFGVTGTYEGSAVNGSLIYIDCSSNIDEVTATVNGNTYTAYLDTSTHKAYVTIPRTDTITAQTCVLKGYNSGSEVTSANLTMSIGIGYYTASLSTSALVYNNGVWTGVDTHSWQDLGGAPATMTEQPTNLLFTVTEHGSQGYDHGQGGIALTPAISMRGYTAIEITVSLLGGIDGPWFCAEDTAPAYMVTDNIRTHGIKLSDWTSVFQIPSEDQGKMLYLYFGGYAEYGAGAVNCAAITRIRFV